MLVGGIAMANTIAFSLEAVMLFYLLNREVPGFFRTGSTIPRALVRKIRRCLDA